LRDRMSDLPRLIEYFVGTLNRKLVQSIRGVTPQAMELLLSYDWPGNIREMINVLEGAMNFCQGSMIDIEDLPFFLRSAQLQNKIEKSSLLQTSMDDAEKNQLLTALTECNGNRQNTANKLGVSRTTLYRLMKKHNLIK
ncbi:MAG: helix-turn-helix domain-containing protein, partial [Chitinophagales bacterium]